ncbi:MAG: hypothetical protein V5A14_04980 [Desulfohalobiaceae bacterium]
MLRSDEHQTCIGPGNKKRKEQLHHTGIPGGRSEAQQDRTGWIITQNVRDRMTDPDELNCNGDEVVYLSETTLDKT